MKLIRIKLSDGSIRYARIIGDKKAQLFSDDYFSPLTDETVDLSDVALLSPVVFKKALCIGLNYSEHIKELDFIRPEKPVVFLKPSTALLDPFGRIEHPSLSERVEYEAELCVVIKDRCRNISLDDADKYILGYTIANDVTARDLQEKTGQWTRCKGFDTFLPIGPYISDEVNPDDLRIQSILNGKVMQDDRTSHLIFPVRYLVSYLSKCMTLERYDVILTGTPKGVSPMKKGDVIICRIESLGELVNYN